MMCCVTHSPTASTSAGLQAAVFCHQQQIFCTARNGYSCKQAWRESTALWCVTEAASSGLWSAGRANKKPSGLCQQVAATELAHSSSSLPLQIEGLNLTKPLSTEHQQLLHELWREHLLLVFRAGYVDPGSQERVLRESLPALITAFHNHKQCR